MLAIKRWMWTAKAAAAVLIAGAALVPVVQMALAETTAAATRPTVATTSGPATTRAKEVTMDLLTPEAMKLWWVEPKHDHYQLKDGELVVHYKEAQGAALRGEIGGMSLDNYQVSLEFFIEDEGTYGVKGRGGFQWNVQIAPRGTLVFCQAFPNTCNICCWDPRQKDPFRHLSDRKNEHYKPGQWNTMELFAEEGRCTLMMNGKLAAEADVPISTKGMLGLVVNFASDATVRIRNMKLTLLEPTPEQVKELATPALKNWENWVAVEKAAGRPGKLSPVDDATTTNRPLERPTSGTEERPGETQPGK